MLDLLAWLDNLVLQHEVQHSQQPMAVPLSRSKVKMHLDLSCCYRPKVTKLYMLDNNNNNNNRHIMA